MYTHDHPLFRQYPLSGRVALSTGEAPSPYHIYDGCGVFIGGTADLGAARDLLRNEQVSPVQTSDGRALMGIWVCDFTDASLGPHHELQFSIFVSRGEVPPVAPRPLGLLAAMLARPDVLMMCHGLWNNTPNVVAYNREALSLNARLSQSAITRDAQAMTFRVGDRANGSPILSGRLSKPRQASARANVDMIALLGFGTLARVSRQPWVGMRVMNPLGVKLAHNAEAQSYTKNEANVIRYFGPQADSLTFGDTSYARLGFAPQFVQHMEGFKFVYLDPA
jgi:hypothetical protein